MRKGCLLLLLSASVVHGDAGVITGPVTINASFDGQGGPIGTAQTAPDVGGAAAIAQVLDAVSGAVTVRDAVTTQPIVSFTAAQFWNAAGIAGTPNAFAQRAVFDPISQRWYVSAEEAKSGPNRVYLAISASNDATGAWKSLALPAQSAMIANTRLAVDSAGVYLTGDVAGTGVVMALPIADLTWSGSAAPSAANLNVLPTATTGVVPAIDPSDSVQSDRRFFIARDVAANGDTAIDVYALRWTGTQASLVALTPVDFGTTLSPPSRGAVQPAPGPALAVGSGALANATANNGVIAGIAMTEAAGELGAWWFELYADPSTDSPPNEQQTGFISDPSADLLAPAIAIASDLSIGVVVGRTSATDAPGIYVTGQGIGDDYGTMRGLVQVRPGVAPYSCAPVGGTSAYGRYSSIASTATGFWAVAQFGASATACTFGTTWINFSLPSSFHPGDDFFGEDDAGFPPHSHDPSAGCGGCATGNDATPLAWLGVAALLLRRRSRPKSRL